MASRPRPGPGPAQAPMGMLRVALDELVGDGVEVLADVVRLRADIEGGVAVAENEGGLPAGRGGTDGVPDVAGDQADGVSIRAEGGGDRTVSLLGRLVAPDGLI